MKSFKQKFQLYRGFTLIELLTVIAIIGILASIVIVGVNDARKKGRDARRKADIASIKNALELYYNPNKKYPFQTETTGICSQDVKTALSALVPTYIASIPNDPQNNGSCSGAGAGYLNYLYISNTTGSSYGLKVQFEDGTTCKTGVNVDNNWWGTSVSKCSF